MKRCRKYLGALLAVTMVLSSSMTDVANAADALVVTPKNMLNVKVVDEAGNPVNGAGISVVNSAGECVYQFTSGGSGGSAGVVSDVMNVCINGFYVSTWNCVCCI